MVTHPQLAKRQRKKNSNERSGFFMDIIKPTPKVSHFNEDNEIVNTTETLDLYNKIGQVTNFNDYAVILHHNVQSLDNKLLDVTC
jgi:hypothetical protein